MRTRFPGVERRTDLFSSNIQIFIQLRSLFWGVCAFKGKAKNTSLVTSLALVSTRIFSCFDFFFQSNVLKNLFFIDHRCDRILWHGNGLIQLSYVRGESRFSDHRPVYSIFMAEVEIIRQRRRNMGCFNSRVEVEELLPYSYSFGDIKFN